MVITVEESYRQPGRKLPPTHNHFFPNVQNITKHIANLTTCDIEFKAKQEKKYVEGRNFLPDTPVDSSIRVQGGLEFMLSHFSEPSFPRKVSSYATRNEQKPVQDITRAMNRFQEGSWLDCRIAAFGIGQTNPDLIFIDLDKENFCSDRAFQMALTKTLKNIKDKLGGFPTVYQSGRGCHVIQPIDCPVNLDDIKKFADLTDSPNNKFLQFEKRYLSNGKADSSNNPAMRSCMIRIPGSLNSKCKAVGIDAEVKIIQRWDGHRPDYRLLLGSFHAYLVGRQQPSSRPISSKTLLPLQQYGEEGGKVIPWIEKLLQTPIDDYRKYARNLIIVPYLVLRRGVTDPEQVCNIVMQWADKCAELKRLEPSRHEFAVRLRSRIYEVIQNRVPHMQPQTLKEKNPDLYKKLLESGGA